MLISELTQWRDSNMLSDTWYLEINEQGWGSVMTLADVETLARGAWEKGGQVRVVHVSMAGNEANWILLLPELKRVDDGVCPGCGAVCEPLIGSFPGVGLSCGEWFGVAAIIFFAFMLGVTDGGIYGWLFLLFASLLLVGRFFREKKAIWRCPNCHYTRWRRE